MSKGLLGWTFSQDLHAYIIIIWILLTDAPETRVKKLKVEIKDMIYFKKSNISTFKK